MLLKKIRILLCVALAVQMQIDGMILPTQRLRSNNIVNIILRNPQEGLDQIEKVHSKILKAAEKLPYSNVSEAQKEHMLEEYCKECPIFLLGDAGVKNIKSLYPHFRKAFENKVTECLFSSLSLARLSTSASKKLVTYTSFGSGLAYQDFVIMVKTLSQWPDAQLDIHFIDQRNKPYIEAAMAIRYTRKIASYRSFDINSYIALQASKTAAEKEHLRDEIGMIEAKYKQFIITLTKSFPNAQLCLRIHDTVDGYLQYTYVSKLSQADVLVAADIEDDSGAINDYKKLSIITLRQNNSSSNICLVNSNSPHSVALVTIALQPTPHSTGEIMGLMSEKTSMILPMYLTRESL